MYLLLSAYMILRREHMDLNTGPSAEFRVQHHRRLFRQQTTRHFACAGLNI
jgi:hypothetical protein